MCKRPGCYHSTSKTHVRDRILKLSPIHASVTIRFPEFAEFSEFLIHLGKTLMNWGKFQETLCYPELAGAVVASCTLIQAVAGSNNLFKYLNFYRLQGKVMFSETSVILFRAGGGGGGWGSVSGLPAGTDI